VGQKVHPYGFRIGFNKTWKSRWFADKDYATLLHEDLKLKDDLKKRFQHAGVAKIEIERAANKLKIDVHTSRPGIIIGRKGTEVDKLKQEIQKRTKREVFINIQEIQKPELDAQLVAESVAMQLEKRVALRVVPARPAAAADAARRHRFRLRRSPHHLRPDWREGVDVQGRTADPAGRPRRGISRSSAPRRGRPGITRHRHVDAEEGQVPEAAARPHVRQGVARFGRVVR
jgi:hypothetical protein